MQSPAVPRPVEVCGLPVHPLTLAESVVAAEDLVRTGGPHQHVVLNAAKIVQAREDPALEQIIRGCALVNADGQSVVWASRILGEPLPERVAGIDFMLALWDSAARNGYRTYLLGAEDDVVKAVAAKATSRGVSVVGYRNGYWGADDEDGVVDAIRATAADLLFLAIPSPRKEEFLSRHLDRLGVALVVGVGGSFDVVAGLRRRAPVWMQHAGLEWLFRLAQEPRRMFRRYLVGNAKFMAIVFSELVHRRAPRRERSVS